MWYYFLIDKRKYSPGKEQKRFKIPYMIATLILDEADNPSKNAINKAVPSRTPHPPMLTGNVIENNTIGVNTKNAK